MKPALPVPEPTAIAPAANVSVANVQAINLPANAPGQNREELLVSLANHLPAAIAYFDINTLVCRFANHAYAVSNGLTAESILGKHLIDIIGVQANAVIAPQVERVVRGEAVHYERESTLPDGSKRQIEVNLIPQTGRDGVQTGAFVLINDITRHHDAERLLVESEERLQKFVNASREGIFFHRNGIVDDVNETALNLVGYSLPEVIGRNTLDFVAPESRQVVADYLAAEGEAPYEAVVLHRSGKRIPVEFTGRTMVRNGETIRMGTMLDISERKEAEARIRFMAHHDALTGLPNRVMLHERLEGLIALARRNQETLAVLFLDLDHFKLVNDSLGHHAGDELLKEVAARISGGVRDADVVARQGGDEFLVVLASLAEPAAAAAVAVKLLVQVAEPVLIEGRSVSVAPSIGISVFPADGGSADELIRHADSAMYLAKQSGRRQYRFYTPSLSRQAEEAISKEADLRHAVQGGHFELHYQAQTDVAGARITGFEALVRWRRRDGTLTPPNEFIAFAEEHGMISAIGRWVLAEACRQNKAWQDAGLPCVPIAVNVSPLQLKTGNLVADVERVLRQTGLEGRYLEIELTEGALVSDNAAITGKFDTLRSLGVLLAIDDFGTGYSSLAYLKRYRIDKLKIDRSFVRDLETEPDDLAISAAIVQMGRTLKLTVLAEGVENVAQLKLLRAQGCQEIQGFLLSKPLIAAEAGDLLRRYPHEELAASQRMRGLDEQ